MIKQIEDKDYYSEVINKKGIVLVNFYANWCGPCMLLNQTLEDIGNSVTNCRIIKVDVDECPQATNLLEVDTVPTTFIYRDGKVITRYVGTMTKKEILKELENC